MRARAILPILAGLAATAVIGGPGAGTAGAAFTTPEYEATFNDGGVIGQAVHVAVDEATHDVYVADQANRRIEKFDSDGNFLFMFGDGVNETTGGNKCPVSPSDSCRPRSAVLADLPGFHQPLCDRRRQLRQSLQGRRLRRRRRSATKGLGSSRSSTAPASSFRPGARRGRWPSRSSTR